MLSTLIQNRVDPGIINQGLFFFILSRVKRTALSRSCPCPDFPESSVWCLSGVRTLSEFAVGCLSVRTVNSDFE